MIITTAVVIRSPSPPAPNRPRININIRVNIRALLYGGGGLNRGFAGRVDHCIENRVTGSGILEGDNLVGGQSIADAGILDLAHNDRIADVGLQHSLDV